MSSFPTQTLKQFLRSLPWLFHQSIVFSQFLSKEISTAKNIKDRLNRKNVCRLLNILTERLPLQNFSKGLIVFAGIDETGKEIVEFVEPNINVKVFYYNCGNKFCTDITNKYMIDCSGVIIFSSGNECIIYEFNEGMFNVHRRINADLQKRQKKGGQSALRIARLAEQSRDRYVTRVVDTINNMDRNLNMIIYGSVEIKKMIIEKPKHVMLKDGGFLNFDVKTIHKNMEYYIGALQNKPEYDHYYKKVELYLDTNIDMLDFDIENKGNMEYYLGKDGIPLPSTGRLHCFEYIGVKYFASEE